MTISRFRDRWYFLSNFFPAWVEIEHPVSGSIDYAPTAEHAYQMAKTLNSAEKLAILHAPGPAEAKKKGRGVTLRDDWEDVKVTHMHAIVFRKFMDNPHLQTLLLKTGDELLIEGNTWHDNIWGDCHCNRRSECQVAGQNLLGGILMQVRHSLQ